jgi:hypothetical protein
MRRQGRRAWRGAQVLAGHAGAAPGAAANPNKEKDLRNVGPSVQYKLRDANGQAREFNNYMLPVQWMGRPCSWRACANRRMSHSATCDSGR